MSLIGVLVTIFMSGVVQMTKDTVRVQNVSNSADEARRAFDRFDRQLRSASEVNRPVEIGTTWYLEFRTTATGTLTPLCTQWRLVGATDQVQVRTWNDVLVPTVSVWGTIASRVINDPAVPAQNPFTWKAADSDYTRQRVTLYLIVSSGQPGGAQVQGTVVARNTSTTTVTNADAVPAPNGDGVSDTQVCQQAGRP
jgi:type II secretory pathway pseudopilin PulG